MKIIRAFVALSTAALVGTLAVACSDPPKEPDDPYVVTSVPWRVPEHLAYVLLDDEQQETIGRGVLSVSEQGGQWVLSQSFEDDDGNTDESVLLTEPETLRPVRSVRSLYDAGGDERRTVDAEYGVLDDGDYGVRIRQRVFDPASDDEPSSTRCNPLRVPESSFDNDSSLFLWRTLPFEDGLEVQYTASIPNRRTTRIVTLVVREPERIETPAGTFDAWHVFILAEGQSHDAWFEVDAPHRMVKYDNDLQVFLLEGDADPPGDLLEPQGVSQSCE